MASAVASTASTTETRRAWRRDAAVLGVLAAVIRLPAFVADAHLTYDDGVFGSSALLLRDGQVPFRDIFSPQGPLFLPLVFVADVLGLRSAEGVRVLPLASGIAVTLGTYAIGRRVTTRGASIVAAGLVTTSGSVLWTTAGLASDGPAMALAVIAVALACGYRLEPSTARAALTGAAVGAALCVKALVLPMALPVGLLLVARRRPRDVAVAAGAAVAVGLAATVPWGFGRVWEQFIEYHRESARIASHLGAARRLVVTLVERDAFVVAAGGLALVTLLLARGRAGPGSSSAADRVPVFAAGTALGAWAVAVAILLVIEPAFWRPHLAHIIPPLALLACLRPAPPRALALAAIVVAPWYLAHVRPMLWPDGYDREEAAAVDELRALPSSAEVITDEPGLAWRAGRRVPGHLVDASIKRIEQRQITTDVLAAAAARPEVCAVLVWDDRYGDFAALPDRLADEGYTVTGRYGGPRVLYERADCAPR